MKFIFMIILWVVLLGIFVPSCGKKVDKLCVKGKAKQEYIIKIQGQNPKVAIMDPGDRIVRKECSEILRSVTFRDTYEKILNSFDRPATIKRTPRLV